MKRELTDIETKKLKSIRTKIMKCAKELDDMNFKVYFANSNLSIMDADKHLNGLFPTADCSNELFPSRQVNICGMEVIGNNIKNTKR